MQSSNTKQIYHVDHASFFTVLSRRLFAITVDVWIPVPAIAVPIPFLPHSNDNVFWRICFSDCYADFI
jgi:hypothetical protein